MKKGFTLIELLAVLVILSIIALIAVPIIINIVENSRKNAFLNSARGMEDAIEYYYAEHVLNEEQFDGKVFDFNDNITDLSLKGETPAGGMIEIDKEGKVSLAIYDNDKKWCAIKKDNDSKIVLLDYNEDTCDYIEYTDENCFTVDSNNSARITGYDANCPKDVVIPKKINGVKITTIGMIAFAWKNISSVYIPPGITTIENFAFNTHNITKLKIPSSVTSIGANAFQGGTIEHLELSEGLSTIGSAAFYQNYLKDIEIPDGVITIDSEAFGHNNLNSVIIPASVTSIGNKAFFYNNKLTNVTIKGKSEIGDFATYGDSVFGWVENYSDSNITWTN